MTNYKHISIEALAPGAWAAMATSNGAAGSNSGIIDLGDQTIVFDTTATLSAAEELFAAAQELTGRAPTYVVNSHSHPDHIHGNKVFVKSSILISSEVTRDEIVRDGIQGMANMHNDLSTQVATFRAQLSEGVDDAARAELEEAISFFEGVLKGYPTPDDLRVPAVTFRKQLGFHGTSRSAQLLTFGGAHSACDAVLWLPEEKVLFAGDVVGTPILCLGYPENWWTLLGELEQLGARVVVAGHRAVSSADEGFQETRDHLNFMFGFAEQAMGTGDPLAYAQTTEVPANQSEYWFRKDLRFLVEHLMNGKKRFG